MERAVVDAVEVWAVAVFFVAAASTAWLACDRKVLVDVLQLLLEDL